MPLIRDFVDEHERATDLFSDAVRAIDRADLDTAAKCLDAMAAGLARHWEGEENGLFAAMSHDQEYAEYIAPLVREHRELARLLAGVNVSDPVDQRRLRAALTELREHISKEEDGLFPAALTALSGAEWDISRAAWEHAHPGESLLPD